MSSLSPGVYLTACVVMTVLLYIAVLNWKGFFAAARKPHYVLATPVTLGFYNTIATEDVLWVGWGILGATLALATLFFYGRATRRSAL